MNTFDEGYSRTASSSRRSWILFLLQICYLVSLLLEV